MLGGLAMYRVMRALVARWLVKSHYALHHRALEFVVSQRIKLASSANLAALDPLTAEHSLLLDGGDSSAQLAVLERREGRPHLDERAYSSRRAVPTPVQAAPIQVVTTTLRSRSELLSRMEGVVSAFYRAAQTDVIQMTKPAEKPLFHVSLGARDDWVVEAEWSDGTLESVNTFKNHSAAARWVATASEAWLHARVRS
jgi:hypothetical protein